MAQSIEAASSFENNGIPPRATSDAGGLKKSERDSNADGVQQSPCAAASLTPTTVLERRIPAGILATHPPSHGRPELGLDVTRELPNAPQTCNMPPPRSAYAIDSIRPFRVELHPHKKLVRGINPHKTRVPVRGYKT